ncbi:MAG TPA: hypothetical protein VGM78_01365 [Ilumatobacteraceae bacterium]
MIAVVALSAVTDCGESVRSITRSNRATEETSTGVSEPAAGEAGDFDSSYRRVLSDTTRLATELGGIPTARAEIGSVVAATSSNAMSPNIAATECEIAEIQLAAVAVDVDSVDLAVSSIDGDIDAMQSEIADLDAQLIALESMEQTADERTALSAGKKMVIAAQAAIDSLKSSDMNAAILARSIYARAAQVEHARCPTDTIATIPFPPSSD